MRTPYSLRRQGGAHAVEFALVLTLFLTLVFAIINFALAAWSYSTLSEAAREGARYGSVLGSGGASTAQAGLRIEERVRAVAVGIPLKALDVRVSWDGGNNDPGSTVVVAASYAFRPAIPFFGRAAFPLSSSASMMISH